MTRENGIWILTMAKTMAKTMAEAETKAESQKAILVGNRQDEGRGGDLKMDTCGL